MADVYIPWEGWELIRPLGQGSFGKVYEIRKSAGGRIEKAAMKVIPIRSDMIDDIYGSQSDKETVRKICEESLRSIQREYELMYELRGNPNIVRVDDMKSVGHRDGIGFDVYIMMELLTPLQKIWKTDTASETDILRLGEDICRALVACEAHNLIHRDIKPQNILVTDGGTYKLGDFGTAKTFEHTSSATMAGTETYMAPEVIMRQKYGRDVDTYSLGLVMYRMLNKGQLPFIDAGKVPTVDERTKSLQRRIAGEQLPPPASGSRPLQAVVLKACSFDREDRYKSAREMLSDLQLAGEGTMPMFRFPSEDRSTVLERTGKGTSGRGTFGGKGTSGTSGRKTNYKRTNTSTSDNGKKKSLGKWFAAIAVIAAITSFVLSNMDIFTPTPPAPEPETPSATDTTGTDTQGTSPESGTQEQIDSNALSLEGANAENFLNEFKAGNFEAAGSWGSKNPEYANEGAVLNMRQDIAEAYKQKAAEYATNADGFTGSYGFSDVDDDGLAEMLVFTPGPEADMQLIVFTYSNGQVIEVGAINGGHTGVYAYPDHNGVIIMWGHMGSQTISVLKIENGELYLDNYGSHELMGENDDYVYPGNAIWFNDCTTM